MNEIEVINLRKRYKDVVALKGISFYLKKGEILGLLGPNGAGKTTTIKILSGMILDFEGDIRFRNVKFSPYSTKIKRLVGVVPQHNNLDKDLTVEQNLKIHGLLFGLYGKRLSKKIDLVLELVGLKHHKKRRTDELSGGMKRRVIIARALMHDPEILFLDEPTAGLDPAVRKSLWNTIIQINSHGCSIILTTHYIEEADTLAQRVLIMNKGNIVATGSPAELKRRIGKYVLEIHSTDGIKEFFFDSYKEALTESKKFRNFRIREVNLEDVFLKITGNRIDI